MASPTIEGLKKEADDISAEYGGRFAGQSRATRDLAELDGLVGRVQDLIRRIEGLPKSAKDGEVDALLDVVRSNLQLYLTERKAIADARREGPDLEAFARVGTEANFVFARYRRHFAGKSRNTRDLGLLAEMIDDLHKLEKRMKDLVARSKTPGVGGDLEVVRGNIKLYTDERGEIVDSRAAGTPEAQADVLAEVANDQFLLYQDHFASKSRVTRRPQLLQRIIDNLRQVKDRMLGLKKAGLKSEQNDRNVGIVETNLQMYINELAEVRKARAGVKLYDLMGNLGSEANDVMEAYRKDFAGKDRKTRDPELLSVLCDRLGEIHRQMFELGRAEPNDMNDRNLAIVSDNLVMLENEYAAISEAKGAK